MVESCLCGLGAETCHVCVLEPTSARDYGDMHLKKKAYSHGYCPFSEQAHLVVFIRGLGVPVEVSLPPSLPPSEH